MTTIALHHTTGELRAAIAAAKARPSDEVTDAERLTIDLADQLLAMIDAGGTWHLDDRGPWIELDQLDADYLEGLQEMAGLVAGGPW